MSQHALPSNLPDDFESCLGVFEENREVYRGVIRSQLGKANSHAVDDILQEMAMAAAAARSDSVRNPASWLRQVLNHKIADFWRRESRQEKVADWEEPNTTAVFSPFEWVIHIENHEEIREALCRLKREDRDLLTRKYLKGESCEQIARALEMTLKAVEYRLNRARKNLREHLNHWKNEC